MMTAIVRFLVTAVIVIALVFLGIWLFGFGLKWCTTSYNGVKAPKFGSFSLPSFQTAPATPSPTTEAERVRLAQQQMLADKQAVEAGTNGLIAETTKANLELGTVLGQPRFGDEIRIAVYSLHQGLGSTIESDIVISKAGEEEDPMHVQATYQRNFPAVRNQRYTITAKDLTGNVQSKTLTYKGGVVDLQFKLP